MRKRGMSSAGRMNVICMLCVMFLPVVCSLRQDSRQFRVDGPFKFVSGIPRGGGNVDRNSDSDDMDDEDRTRFWSLSALFRLNANAKDDASSSSASSHLQRGNKRGGALAVRMSKSRTRVDVTPVATASSQLLMDDEEVESDRNDDEPKEPLSFENIQGSEIIEVGEMNVVEVDEEESEDEADDSDEQSLSASEQFIDETPTLIEANDVQDDAKEDDYESGIENQDGNIEEMMGVEILQRIKEEAVLETEEPTTLSGANAFVEEKKSSDEQGSDSYVSTKAKDMIQDATKYWWTNVGTEQTSAEMPELEERVSGESYAKEVALSEEVEIIEEQSDAIEQQDDSLVSGEVVIEQLDEVGAIDVEVDVEDGELDEMTAREPIMEEPPSDVSIRRAEEQVLERPEDVVEDFHPEVSIEAEETQVVVPEMPVRDERRKTEESPFISSGYWGAIDRVASLGLSDVNPNWKLSRRLHSVRKATAHVTGLHGVISQKRKRLQSLPENAIFPSTASDATLDDDDLGMIQRRIAAIEIAKQNVAKQAAERADTQPRRRRGLFRRGRRRGNQADTVDAAAEATSASFGLDESEISSMYLNLERKSLEEQLEDERRRERVQEIDRLISKGQKALLDLQCEKDDLQRRPNPLYNYTTGKDGKTTRTFSFPPQELVDEYIDELFANGRLEKMNHTHLWKNGGGLDDDEDESIGDDLFVPSADARKLYETKERRNEPSSRGPESKPGNGNGGGGSWLLRQNLGKGGSLGEKIGETTETAAYKAVCSAVMSSLARSIAAIHGVNIMTHSDIRLYMEQSPDLPPVGRNVIPGSSGGQNYAQEAIMDAMRKGVTKRKKRGSRSRRQRVEEAFMQRDAVVETLLSHCQISAPLLKLFPISWQRALLGNIITLIAAVVSDFCDGIQLQILGHQLSFAYKPITESDMIRHIGTAGGFNHRRARPEQFEAAIRATANDVSDNLQFLDRWHHRALGSGMLRAQIANLIARIVLTLADEVLSGARMDLWSAQAGGPRMLAGLEYRVGENDVM